MLASASRQRPLRLATALTTLALAPMCLGACAQDLDVGNAQGEIVGGMETSDYPAVANITVRIASGEGFNCSSTLISPRVLLTAAHCIDLEEGTAVDITAYFGTRLSGQDTGFIQEIAAEDWIFFNPWSLSGNDIAMVLLEHDADVEPMIYNTQVLGSNAIGVLMRIVGWGNSAFEVGSGRKRLVQTPVTGFLNNVVISYGNDDENTCQGDSGGPGFLTFSDGVNSEERIASITSFGPTGCGGTSGGTRVAQYADFIGDWVAEKDVAQPPLLEYVTPQDGQEVGAGFQVHVEASDDTRLENVEIYINGALEADLLGRLPPFVISTPALPDGPVQIEARAYDNRGDVTSRIINVTLDSTCDGDQDCQGVFQCSDAGVCEAPNYQLGDSCNEGPECASGQCATVGEDQLCTDSCTPSDSASCPDGFECLETGDDVGLCWPGSGESGGCSTGGRTGILGSLLMLVAFAAFRRRRDTNS